MTNTGEGVKSGKNKGEIVLLEPNLRRDIHLEAIPYTWHSNLGDAELKDIYEQLLRARFFVGPPALETVKSANSTVTRFWWKAHEFEYRDGICRLTAFDHVIRIVYGTNEEWQRWDAVRSVRDRRNDAASEAIERQREEKLAQEAQLRERYFELCDQADKKRETCEQYEAERLSREALSISESAPNLGLAGHAISRCLVHYSSRESPDHGLAFLRERKAKPKEYMTYAKCFEPDRIDLSASVYRAAIAKFPEDAGLYKSHSIMLARNYRIAEAIAVCDAAIARGLHDDTKTGFLGRRKRLMRKLSGA